jgi:hypothetical protein
LITEDITSPTLANRSCRCVRAQTQPYFRWTTGFDGFIISVCSKRDNCIVVAKHLLK